MINFADLVHTLLEDTDFLLEAAPSRKDDIFNFHFTDKRYNDVKSVFDQKYSGISLPSRDSFKPVIDVIFNRSRSPMINPDKLPGIEIYFPVFDLLCLLDTILTPLTGKDQQDGSKTQTQFDTWLARFKADTSSVPLEYVPTESTAIILQRKLRSTTDLGDLRIDSLNKTFSFYRATEELLEIRRGIKKRNKTWIGSKMDAVFDSSGIQTVQKILFNPLTIISGAQSVSKDLESIFDYGIIEKITNISISFYTLYKKEITDAVDFFISNTSLTTKKNRNRPDVISYLNTKLRAPLLGNLYKDMELYTKYLGDSTKDYAEAIDFYSIIDTNLKKMEPALIPGKMPNPAQFLKFTSGDKSNPFKCTYNLEKLILNNKGGYKEAQEVYRGLQYFADFIAKKESPDMLGAATSIAGGLSFGVKNMGE